MVEPPSVPDERLTGWRLHEERTEELFSLPGAGVHGHTRLYEDATLREQVHAATGADQVWRFFFATALEFRPSLSRTAARIVKPTVVTEARRRFVDDLRDRGFESVDRAGTSTMRVDGERARLSSFRASYPLSIDDEELDLDVAGHLAVWLNDGFRLAGGAYPDGGLDRFGIDTAGFREELLKLIRAVD